MTTGLPWHYWILLLGNQDIHITIAPLHVQAQIAAHTVALWDADTDLHSSNVRFIAGKQSVHPPTRILMPIHVPAPPDLAPVDSDSDSDTESTRSIGSTRREIFSFGHKNVQIIMLDNQLYPLLIRTICKYVARISDQISMLYSGTLMCGIKLQAWGLPATLLARNALGHECMKGTTAMPMHEICMARRPCPALREAVIALLNAGTGPRLVDNESATPLHHLYRFTESCTTVACALLGHGADVNTSDDEGLTPLHYACTTRRVPEGFHR
ncbi:hypothetical protein EDD85DRAFT_786140 [Armillaria nabsnona]|nr:hypothetical protein EDD85DRAFT_786140 [Armillaria nabsnona]